MKRRQFLKLGSVASGLAFAKLGQTQARARSTVLVHLKGGCDGLNLAVPFAQNEYARLRPRLALSREHVVPLSEQLGLPAELTPLMPMWREQQLAIVQGVGFEPSSQSHFRAMDIWHSARVLEPLKHRGWVAEAWQQQVPKQLCGLVFGDSQGPLAGHWGNSTFWVDAGRKRAATESPAVHSSDNLSLQHLIHTQRRLQQVQRTLAPVQTQGHDPEFPNTDFGQQLAKAARLIQSPHSLPVLHLTLPGFDTHAAQKPKQARLFADLARSLAAFRERLMASGHWPDVLCLVYSEFGRRVPENGLLGTDHGAAGVALVCGGRIRGGVYGVPPDLTALVAGNLPVGVDFRRLYSTLYQHWWGFVGIPPWGRFPSLPLLT